MAEALALIEAAGLDPEQALEVMGGGAAGSTILQLKGSAMLTRDFTPHFKLSHMLKDLRNALAEAGDLDVRAELTETTARVYERAAASGHDQQDFSAVAAATGGAPAPAS